MASTLLGRLDWHGGRNREGHREYTIKWLIEAATSDGPVVIFNTSGLPAIGSTWSFGSDLDAWAFCTPDWKAKQILTKEPNNYWALEQKFSTIPLKRCQDSSIENPLNEPDRISGSFTKYTREALRNYDGTLIKTSSHEQIRGREVERDDNRPNVTIEKNLSSHPLSTYAPMIDTVNDASLWGLDKRMIKLSNVSWTRKLYGTCTFYYTVSYEFDINYDTFDKKLIDKGTKVLAPGGDPSKPDDFIVYKDKQGENSSVILDGAGEAWDGTGTPGEIDYEPYAESNFLLLGVPATL